MAWDIVYRDPETQPASQFPLSISSSGRYLQDAQGAPFLLHGDTPWSIAAQLTDAECDAYVDNRAAKGFTAIMFSAPEFGFTSQTPITDNVDGTDPFTSMSGDYNWTINSTYWNRVDRIVNRCKSNNMACIVNPAYLGYNGGSEGCYAQLITQSDGTLQSYGASLANRYTQGNVIWCLGGDYAGAGTTQRTKQWQIVTGIRSVRTTDIVTAHGAPQSDSITSWSGYTGLNLNFSYPETANVYAWCATSYGRSGPVPFIMGEAIYEQERGTPITAAGLRRQSYTALLSGACGQMFGNSPIWHFEAPNAPYSYSGTWESNLDSTGSTQQQYVKQLFTAYQWWILQPKTDTSLVSSSLSSGDSRITPALASDGTFAMIYVPSSQTVTVVTTALTGVSGNVRIRLYNPTSGAYSTNQASVAKSSGQSVATGGERIIVVDAAVTSSFSWTDNGSDSYDVGWDTTTHASGDVNDPTLYPNRESVGTNTSWTNTQGVTVYVAVRSVVNGEVGPWSSEHTLSA